MRLASSVAPGTIFTQPISYFERDSNPYPSPDPVLSRERLPIPPSKHIQIYRKNLYSKSGPDENRTRHDLPAREFRLPWYMPAQKRKTVEEIILYKTLNLYIGRLHCFTPYRDNLIDGLTTWSFLSSVRSLERDDISVPLSLLFVRNRWCY